MVEQRANVVDMPCEKVIYTDYPVSFLYKAVAKIGSDEPGASGNQYG
jgi:hypothetical protein